MSASPTQPKDHSVATLTLAKPSTLSLVKPVQSFATLANIRTQK